MTLNIDSASAAIDQINILLPEKINEKDALIKSVVDKLTLSNKPDIKIGKEDPLAIKKKNIPNILNGLFQEALLKKDLSSHLPEIIKKISYAKLAIGDTQFDSLMKKALENLNATWHYSDLSVITQTLPNLFTNLGIKSENDDQFKFFQEISQSLSEREKKETVDEATEENIRTLASARTLKGIQDALASFKEPTVSTDKIPIEIIQRSQIDVKSQIWTIGKVALGALAVLAVGTAGISIARSNIPSQTGELALGTLHTFTNIPASLSETWHKSTEQKKALVQEANKLWTTVEDLSFEDTTYPYLGLKEEMEYVTGLLKESISIEDRAGEFWFYADKQLVEKKAQAARKTLNTLIKNIDQARAQAKTQKKEAQPSIPLLSQAIPLLSQDLETTSTQVKTLLINVENAEYSTFVDQASASVETLTKTLSETISPKEAATLVRQTTNNLKALNVILDGANQSATALAEQAVSLVKTITTSNLTATPAETQARKLASDTGRLLNARDTISEGIKTVSDLLSQTEKLWEEYTSVSGQLSRTLRETDADNAWIMAKVQSAWHFVFG